MKSLKSCFNSVGKISSAGPELGRWWDNRQCPEQCYKGGFSHFAHKSEVNVLWEGFNTHRTQSKDCNWTNNQNCQFQHSWGPEGSQLFWDTTRVLLCPCCQWQGGGEESLTKCSEVTEKKSYSNHKPEGPQLLAQILQILRNSWYKKYTPDPKSPAGHLRADGKFWALLILLFFQRKKLKPHDFPSLLTFQFILSHYCNLVALEKKKYKLKIQVLCNF